MPPPRSPRLALYPALGLLAALAAACAKKPLPVVKAAPGEVEYAGCYEVQREGPVCYLGRDPKDRELSIHPVAPASRYEVLVDGRPLQVAPVSGLADSLFRLTLAPHASRLELRSFGPTSIRLWTLRIADWPAAPAWMNEAWTLYQRGGANRLTALRLLDREIERCTDRKVQAVSLGFRSSLEAEEGTGTLRVAAFQRAIAAHRAVGYIQGELFLANGLVFRLIQAHDFSTARAVLQSISLPDGRPVEALRRLIHLRGLLARDSGDFRTAIGEFEAEADLASSLGLERHRLEALQSKALALTRLGQYKDADELLTELTSKRNGVTDPCPRAINLTNLGWARYLARESGDWNLGDPIVPFSEARDIYHGAATCNNQAREKVNATLNLALALLQSNRLAEAEEVVAKADPKAFRATPAVRMWWLDLQARLALNQGKAGDALALYDRLADEAKATVSPENEWRAAYGRARALQSLSRLEEATRSLAAAEALVDFQLARVPLGAGRESFSDQGSTGSRLYVEILLRLGQTEQALLVARRARARVLAKLAESARTEALSPQERKERDSSLSTYWRLRGDLDQLMNESWQAPGDQGTRLQADLQRRLRETQGALDQALSTLSGATTSAPPLRRPKRGELLLSYFPLSTARRWAAFSDDGATISVTEFTLPSGDFRSLAAQTQLARALLEPFHDEILAARRLIVLPYGLLKSVDFQALPFGGGDNVLLSGRPVVYGLDIPTRSPTRPPGTARALIVSDSRRDLPEARLEGEETQAALLKLAPPWSVMLLQGNAATAAAVRRGILDGVDLFHYAGHADFSARGGWESQIPLAEESRLTLGDILILNRQPRWVVLSGCETGASDDAAQVESQGLAHAFLLGGAESVVAASRKVDDRIARQLVVEMYRRLSGAPDLAALLQQAQEALRKRGVNQREWSAFRVFEP